jgi:hypothetical protein
LLPGSLGETVFNPAKLLAMLLLIWNCSQNE